MSLRELEGTWAAPYPAFDVRQVPDAARDPDVSCGR
jgi:hypothetical protein